MPELVHQPLYDEKHRYRMVGQERTRPELLQKGEREELLCDECERRFQRWEHWFSQYWYHGSAIPERIGSTLTLRDLDYRKLKKGLPQNPHVTLRG